VSVAREFRAVKASHRSTSNNRDFHPNTTRAKKKAP